MTVHEALLMLCNIGMGRLVAHYEAMAERQRGKEEEDGQLSFHALNLTM